MAIKVWDRREPEPDEDIFIDTRGRANAPDGAVLVARTKGGTEIGKIGMINSNGTFYRFTQLHVPGIPTDSEGRIRLDE